jgi:hypothetical protein
VALGRNRFEGDVSEAIFGSSMSWIACPPHSRPRAPGPNTVGRAFVVTDEGRRRAERLRLGGATELERARQQAAASDGRAAQAEQALADERQAITDAADARQQRRERLASRLALLPAVIVAVTIGVVAYYLGEQSQLSAVVGIAFAVGLSGASFVPVVRRLLARGLVRLMLRIHELT